MYLGVGGGSEGAIQFINTANKICLKRLYMRENILCFILNVFSFYSGL